MSPRQVLRCPCGRENESRTSDLVVCDVLHGRKMGSWKRIRDECGCDIEESGAPG